MGCGEVGLQKYFEIYYTTCPSDPSSIDYLDASYHEDPFYGENVNTENLKDLLKEAENPTDGLALAENQPRTSTIRTTVNPTIREETKMTKERRGMLEVTVYIRNIFF